MQCSIAHGIKVTKDHLIEAMLNKTEVILPQDELRIDAVSFVVYHIEWIIPEYSMCVVDGDGREIGILFDAMGYVYSVIL